MQVPKPVIFACSFLVIVVLLGVFTYGVSVQRYGLFPYRYIDDMEAAVLWFWERSAGETPWYYKPTDKTVSVRNLGGKTGDQSLNLLTSIGANDRISVRVIDMQGNRVHKWPVDWFDIWPDPSHVRPADQPKSAPGGHVHGIVMLDDGSIVFNFEKLAMVRMGLCGEVIWKLPYRTHHSVFVDEDGNLWAAGLKVHEERMDGFPNHVAPVHETTVLKISPDGEILREISLFDIFIKNKRRAWLQMGADKLSNVVTGDALHLNDVEVFPSDMASELFSAGDIMLSLRNINTVLVFEPETLEIKYWKTGGFMRQHDPDFIDDGKIAVFDNFFVAPQDKLRQSRIVIVDPVENKSKVWYAGDDGDAFFTRIMGKQQWLANGNVLIADSVNGRAIEVTPQGEIVWEFVNITEPGQVGLVEEIQRLPPPLAKLIRSTNCTA